MSAQDTDSISFLGLNLLVILILLLLIFIYLMLLIRKRYKQNFLHVIDDKKKGRDEKSGKEKEE